MSSNVGVPSSSDFGGPSSSGWVDLIDLRFGIPPSCSFGGPVELRPGFWRPVELRFRSLSAPVPGFGKFSEAHSGELPSSRIQEPLLPEIKTVPIQHWRAFAQNMSLEVSEHNT